MAKTPTVNTITSGYASQTQLNENFTNIQTAFENTLSLDGSTPNAMGADLDLNNNDLLNIGSFQAQTITLAGATVDLSDIQTLTNIATDIQTLADIEDGTEGTDVIQTVAGVATEVAALGPIATNITTVSGIASDVTNVANNSANVTTVAGISSDVTTVSGISADVSTVAADGTDIGVVAGLSTEVQALGAIPTDITTVSGISTNVTTVAGISSNVSTVAGVASGITTLSPISADITTVSGISADVTAVANISSDITAINAQLSDLQTVADDLNEATSEIETVAASITNVDLVGTNITSVNTVAGNLSEINSFFAVYRTGATEPTTSLDAGDLFYNTASGTLKVYNGTAWEQGVVAGSGFLAQASNLSDLNDPAASRVNLGVEIGVDVQAYDATILNDADIGVTVQGYNTNLAGINQGLATTDSPTFVTLNATTVDLGDWTVTESAGSLYFATGGVNKMKLDASGNLDVVGNVNTNATIS